MKRFDIDFSLPVSFHPYGYHISRNEHTKESAHEIFKENLESDFSIYDIKESWVRWQPVPGILRDELDGFAWITCDEKDRNSQPTWSIDYE